MSHTAAYSGGLLLGMACLLFTGCGGSQPAKGPKRGAPEGAGLAGGAGQGANPAAARDDDDGGPAPGRIAPSIPKSSASELEEERDDTWFSVAADPNDVAPRFALDVDGKTADAYAVVRPTGSLDSTRFIAGAAPAAPTQPSAGDGQTNVGPTDSQPIGLGGGNSSTGSKLPKGFVAVAEGGISSEGWPWRIHCEADNAEMVFIPGGPTMFGGPEGPPVNVMLDSFYIDLHEVTSAQYEEFRAASKGKWDKPTRVSKDPLEPVLGVNFGEASAYGKWAGKTLPTEPQWERAARGPEGFRAPWGNGTHLWHRPRTTTQIDTVQSFPTDLSPFGVFDMAGNAREWCLDWFAADALDQLRKGNDSTPRNPSGPKHGGGQLLHVVKGNGANWNLVDRQGVRTTERLPDIGFRCVLNLLKDEAKPAGDAKPPRKPRRTVPVGE